MSRMTTDKTYAVANKSIEISIRGRWVRVPALYVNGRAVVVDGKWIRVNRSLCQMFGYTQD